MGRARKTIMDFPDSWETSYADINVIQQQLTGERFPSIIFGICDNCKWCYSCINPKAVIDICPTCGYAVSHIPMNLDETCIVEKDEKRGLTINFDRRLPLR